MQWNPELIATYLEELCVRKQMSESVDPVITLTAP